MPLSGSFAAKVDDFRHRQQTRKVHLRPYGKVSLQIHICPKAANVKQEEGVAASTRIEVEQPCYVSASTFMN